jgi:hypothetical protein
MHLHEEQAANERTKQRDNCSAIGSDSHISKLYERFSLSPCSSGHVSFVMPFVSLSCAMHCGKQMSTSWYLEMDVRNNSLRASSKCTVGYSMWQFVTQVADIVQTEKQVHTWSLALRKVICVCVCVCVCVWSHRLIESGHEEDFTQPVR